MVAQWVAQAEPSEIALAAAVATTAGLVPVALLSWMIGACLGSHGSPTRRAALTVGLAYLATVAIMALGEWQRFGPLLALVPLPDALAVFAWRRHFDRTARHARAASRG